MLRPADNNMSIIVNENEGNKLSGKRKTPKINIEITIWSIFLHFENETKMYRD